MMDHILRRSPCHLHTYADLAFRSSHLDSRRIQPPCLHRLRTRRSSNDTQLLRAFGFASNDGEFVGGYTSGSRVDWWSLRLDEVFHAVLRILSTKMDHSARSHPYSL
ncbi:hypothetical protein LSAT2_009124 [Lamellibrachia satsuma]|nr:hypothetical protein LSAT2_009124 [Lamellibrachia satsuma]